jgi:hypothetical protein
MIAVISFICRPSVLLPAPDEGPALTIYQEAGQFCGGLTSLCLKKEFGARRPWGDSKTGRAVCSQIMQKPVFA